MLFLLGMLAGFVLGLKVGITLGHRAERKRIVLALQQKSDDAAMAP